MRTTRILSGLLLWAAVCPAERTPRRADLRQRQIVILGSSTANGVGASNYRSSWAGRLAAALESEGYVVTNRSLNGSSTAVSIARFARDVEPLRPKYVILATAITNEFLFQNMGAARNSYLENVRHLLRLCEQIGATPIVAGPNPNAAFTRNHRTLLKEVYLELEAEGVAVWNFLNAADDGLGRWFTAFSVDGLHPTDTGHAQLFSSIPLSYFRRGKRARAIAAVGTGSWQLGKAEGCAVPLDVTLGSEAASWTVAFWVSGDSDRNDVLLTAADLEVMRTGRQFQVSRGSQTLLQASPDSNLPAVHVALVHHSARQQITLYLNGSAAGVAMLPDPNGLRRISLGGYREEHQRDIFSNFLLYRTPLDADDVHRLYTGRSSTASLEAWLPMNHSPDRRLLNHANTSLDVTACRGAWSWSPISLPAPAIQ